MPKDHYECCSQDTVQNKTGNNTQKTTVDELNAAEVPLVKKERAMPLYRWSTHRMAVSARMEGEEAGSSYCTVDPTTQNITPDSNCCRKKQTANMAHVKQGGNMPPQEYST